MRASPQTGSAAHPTNGSDFVGARWFPRRGCVLVLGLTILWSGACGGDDNPGIALPQPTNPSPPATPPSSQNPCIAALQQDLDAIGREFIAPPDPGKAHGGYGNDKRDVREPLWEHYLRAPARLADAPIARADQDIGDIAVLEDDGTLFLRENAFDLRGAGLRFEHNGAGGYDVTRIDPSFRQNIGRRLTLADDATSQEMIGFGFSFYGRTHSSVFVNSDGNLTFEDADTATSTRGFARLLGGPPRVAPFFADLDPSVGTGRIFVQSAADAFVVTWCGVPGFESPRTVTVQAALLPTGTIELTFGDQIELTDGIVALSPGRTGSFTPVDLSATGRLGGGGAAMGERFAQTTEFDTVAVARRFYASHPDTFDQLVFWADTSVVGDGAFAFESTVANAIRGIGQDIFDASRDFGSAGRLQSFLVMDRLGKYPDDPMALALGENSSLAVLAHETGHRWLALLRFRDGSGQSSDMLLGRQRAHWSFFMDTDASVMEGNDIEDLRGGAFRTIGAVQRYSRLDMYAMGLATAAEVASFFYVDAPINVQPDRNRESAPRTGVTFNGTRRDVLIQDVIDALGARQPSSAEAPRVHRQAFVYIIGRGATPGPDVQKLERIRQEWGPFFQRATEGRMTVETNLR
jgi:hypothetical protein